MYILHLQFEGAENPVRYTNSSPKAAQHTYLKVLPHNYTISTREGANSQTPVMQCNAKKKKKKSSTSAHGH